MDFKEKINNLPSSSGVYIMKGAEGEVLYVGKAGNLKKRVASYFRPSRKAGDRIDALVSRVKDISYIQTSTEAEALIYENSLIKELSPKYNVALRDDKSYPMLKLTVNEAFPRLLITRQKKNDGAIYYGPYTNVRLLREALIILKQIFRLRSCVKMPKKICLNYHINQCLAPCVGKIDEKSYGEIISELKLFVDGKPKELLNLLSEKMLEASKREDFEEAEALKSRIEALSSVREKTIVYDPLNETEELKRVVGIKKDLDIIEAFDASNIMGKESVGSMICFYRARPQKSNYRKFKIKTISGIDDYAMIREIVTRRYTRLLEEKKRLPDLIVIDGGKGHLAVAAEALARLGLSKIAVIGIAKEFEHIYLKGRAGPAILPKESKALHLLKRIRDEAHRFAIGYHKRLVSKKIEASELDGIPGIGDKRKRLLISHFGSVDRIKKGSLEELLKIDGMNEKSAKNIISYFKR